MFADRAQKTLFPEPIKSIGFDQIDILQDIMTLYCPQGFECDPTYSIGNFYKSYIPQPKYKFDINPQVPGVIQASADHLPLENESISSLNFDPPYIVNPSSNIGRMHKRFGYFKNMKELLSFYRNCIREAYRVLKPTGIYVFKCQDYADGKNYFHHVTVFNEAVNIGFQAVDIFVLLAKNRMIGHNHHNQHHARKYHSYFWVFQKQSLN